MTEPTFRYSQMDVDAMGHATVDGQRRSRRQIQAVAAKEKYVCFMLLLSMMPF